MGAASRTSAPPAAPTAGAAKALTAPAASESPAELATSGPAQPPPALRAPVAGPVLAPFGWAYSPVFADWQEHTGVDLGAAVGQAVVAPGAGVVVAVRRDSLWGWVVSVALGDGYSTNLSALGSVAVQTGQAVRPGQTLGAVGTSPPAEGNLAPHVFWQLFSGTRPLNPLAG